MHASEILENSFDFCMTNDVNDQREHIVLINGNYYK